MTCLVSTCIVDMIDHDILDSLALGSLDPFTVDIETKRNFDSALVDLGVKSVLESASHGECVGEGS
jgi:hypothetical protein